ncbi:MAG: class I SAM-dependent methyltransferase [Betaproteobacteria bacterium]|nr:class I SAM-dependent methyltransferase [Betaproteobacteria bacterium]MDH5220468.1 class I SAM-dependent methyltransferase [Betaproteobacteria bacterium]MDH5350169.1 class I SAM-dependent methyltransferase [Betaproteobacteria bacterium]
MSPRLDPPAFHSRWHHLRALRRALEREAAALEGKGTLIDLGCGEMPYRPLFEPRVKRYIGADLPRNPKADVSLDESGGAAVADACADIVLSSQVLEHVPSPPTYLAEAHRVLKATGTLLLSTHGYWMYHPDPTDYWRWTREGLVRQIEAAGFEVQSVCGVMNLAASGLQLFQDGVAAALPAALRPAFHFAMNRAMWLVDRLGSDASRDRDAGVFIVRASKRAQAA